MGVALGVAPGAAARSPACTRLVSRRHAGSDGSLTAGLLVKILLANCQQWGLGGLQPPKRRGLC
jgi:hypothetical protein